MTKISNKTADLECVVEQVKTIIARSKYVEREHIKRDRVLTYLFERLNKKIDDSKTPAELAECLHRLEELQKMSMARNDLITELSPDLSAMIWNDFREE